MKNKIIYGSLIAIMAIMISITAYQVEAKTFDKTAGFDLKGVGVYFHSLRVDGNDLSVNFYPINDDTGRYFIDYRSNHNGDFSGGLCTGFIHFKDSSIKKIDASFNTSDLQCSLAHFGSDDNITISVTGDGKSKLHEKDDTISCIPYGEVEICSRVSGTSDNFSGTGTLSGFGLTFENQVGTIKDVQVKYSEWTNP